MEFEIGEIVTIRKKTNQYSITTNLSLLKIVDIYKYSNTKKAQVRLLEHKTQRYQDEIGTVFTVYYSDLEKYSRIKLI